MTRFEMNSNLTVLMFQNDVLFESNAGLESLDVLLAILQKNLHVRNLLKITKINESLLSITVEWVAWPYEYCTMLLYFGFVEFICYSNLYTIVSYITVTEIIREQRSMNKTLISSKREFRYRSSTKVKETQNQPFSNTL